MAKPAWGTKRVCGGCGAPFYDLMRVPIVCPKCEAKFDPEQMVRLKRSRGAVAESKAKPAVVPEESKPKDAEEELESVGAKLEDVEEDDAEPDDTVLVGDDDTDDDPIEVIVDGVGKEKTVE